MNLIISYALFCYLPLLLLSIFSINFFISITKKKPFTSLMLKPPPVVLHRPPAPPALPIIGHLHLLRSGFSKSLKTLARRHGPLMTIRLASQTSVIVSNAAVAKEILKDNEMNFVSRPVLPSSAYAIYQDNTFVFAEYGTYWRFMKKLCMTKLLSVAQVNRFADIRREERMKLLETLFRCSDEGRACDLGKEIVRLTNNIICRMVMSTVGSRSNSESERVWKFVKGIVELMLKFSLNELLGPVVKLDLFGHGRKLKVLLLEFDAFEEEVIGQHEMDLKSGGKKREKDIMDILLEISGDEKAEIKLNKMNIKSFLLEMFMAGTETSSVVLEWAIAELINHPNVYMKLREEINGIVGSCNKRLVEESDVPNLPYLQSVVKETLRLHPSAPLIFRKCQKPCKINGYDLLENERIIFNLNAIMRDPNCWESPLEFIPERFNEVNPKEQHDHYKMELKGQNFSLFPFGSGRRGCPGASLALSIIHIMVATLVQCFDFRIEGGRKLNIEEGSGFSSAMAHPLVCYPVAQFNPFDVPHNSI